MIPAHTSSPASSPLASAMSLFRSTEAWLDARGRWAWLATMVVSFFIAPPMGLIVLGYMIWSKRMFGSFTLNRRNSAVDGAHLRGAGQSSGNAAFDAYKAETLRRLSDEQDAFEAFMARLREARDKQEFDRFMEERAHSTKPAAEVEPALHSSEEPRRGSY